VLAGLIVAAAAMAGMAVQRSTGLGFALVAVPVFTMVVGPFQGVLLANALAMPVNLGIFLATWRGLDVRKLWPLATAAVVAVVPGAMVARHAPAELLLILAGTSILMGVLLLGLRIRPAWLVTRWGVVAAGVSGGFLNATAATGGPPVAIYAAASTWPHASFVPTLQLANVAINGTSLLMKGWPPFPGATALMAAAGLVLGALAGGRLVRVVPIPVLVRGGLFVAAAGGVVTLTKGIVLLIG
jgi:uncharacterized membrane protein YfcA